jgi:hypothetical protein
MLNILQDCEKGLAQVCLTGTVDGHIDPSVGIHKHDGGGTGSISESHGGAHMGNLLVGNESCSDQAFSRGYQGRDDVYGAATQWGREEDGSQGATRTCVASSAQGRLGLVSF